MPICLILGVLQTYNKTFVNKSILFKNSHYVEKNDVDLINFNETVTSTVRMNLTLCNINFLN